MRSNPMTSTTISQRRGARVGRRSRKHRHLERSVTPDEIARPTTQVEQADNPHAPYLPLLTINWIRHSPDVNYRVGAGTVAFVDISGFSKLAEGLAREGKVGAEELTVAIG